MSKGLPDRRDDNVDNDAAPDVAAEPPLTFLEAELRQIGSINMMQDSCEIM
jgi:hypothetical protein